MPVYPLSIITPEGMIYSDTVESLIAPGFLGSFGILAHHAPMVTALRPGILRLEKNNQSSFFILGAGTLEVDLKHHVTILADCAIQKASLEEAKQHLKSLLPEESNQTGFSITPTSDEGQS